MDYLCPYKSPQAWAMFKVLAWILGPSSLFSRPIISQYLRKKFHVDDNFSAGLVSKKLQHLGDWFSVDVDIIERFSRIAHCPDMYGMKAYRWLKHEFGDSPSMLLHLITLLQELPPQLVMPAIFDNDIVRLDRECDMEDVRFAFVGVSLWDTVPFNYSRSHIRLLTYHLFWANRGGPKLDLIEKCWALPPSWGSKYISTPRECCAPLTRILRTILDAPKKHTRLVLPYIEHFLQHRADIDLRLDNFDLTSIVSLFGSLATIDLNFSETKWPLFNLLNFMNDRVREKADTMQSEDVYLWIDGLETLRIGQGLQKDYFGRQSGFFPVSMNHISTLLGKTTTHGSALERMQEYRLILNTTQTDGYRNTADWTLDHLTSFIFHNISANSRDYPPHLWEGLRQSKWIVGASIKGMRSKMPYLLTSQEGLAFLKSLDTIMRAKFSGNPNLLEELRPWKFSLTCVAHLNRQPLDFFDSPAPTSTPLADGDDASHDRSESTANGGENDASPVGPSTSTKERRGDKSHKSEDIVPGAISSGPAGLSLTPSLQEIGGDEKPGEGAKMVEAAASNSDPFERRLVDCLIGD
ncbi:hypothetical protein AAF712_009207 [Marasmius tenuissimus]|uniref:Uncharacterized protein n=1 Tax=Marasmius tenuissimus TaxID=585030 RepID=A0ABR2ZQA7_9AGAR